MICPMGRHLKFDLIYSSPQSRHRVSLDLWPSSDPIQTPLISPYYTTSVPYNIKFSESILYFVLFYDKWICVVILFNWNRKEINIYCESQCLKYLFLRRHYNWLKLTKNLHMNFALRLSKIPLTRLMITCYPKPSIWTLRLAKQPSPDSAL